MLSILPPILLRYIIQPSKTLLCWTIKMDLSLRLTLSLTLLDLDNLICFTLAILNPFFVGYVFYEYPYPVWKSTSGVISQPSDDALVVYESEASWSATSCIQLTTMWLTTTVTADWMKIQRSHCSWAPFYAQNLCWFFTLFILTISA